jgi:hypothetical protein
MFGAAGTLLKTTRKITNDGRVSSLYFLEQLLVCSDTVWWIFVMEYSLRATSSTNGRK